jgi:hypothetical protein
MIKSRLRWDELVARKGSEEKYMQDSGGEVNKENDHQEDPDIDGRLILGEILEKEDEALRTSFVWFRIGTDGRAFVKTVMMLGIL